MGGLVAALLKILIIFLSALLGALCFCIMFLFIIGTIILIWANAVRLSGK